MRTIQADQLQETLNAGDGTPVINTLPEDAYHKKHIPHTVNVPQESADFVNRVERMTQSKADPVVVYCAKLSCDSSTKAAQKLESAGFTNVYEFEGGVEEWEQRELPLETGV
jgi:rhodanese-related sulfurtransferase